MAILTLSPEPYQEPNPAATWCTACFGAAAAATPSEARALGEHLNLCRTLGGRLFALRCAAEDVRDLMASHLVTSVLLCAGLAAFLAHEFR